MVSFNDQIPKKSCKEAKHCTLCKKHGGVQNTHSTGNCEKYNLDGTPKKGLAGKNAQCNPCNGSVLYKQNTSYMQLSAKIAKLEKSNRKLKHTNKMHKRNYNSNSNDSDAP